LAREIEDVQQHGEKVEEVSIGLDGDWFLSTNMRSGRFSFDRDPLSIRVGPSILD
jgi:hypothetical protein